MSSLTDILDDGAEILPHKVSMTLWPKHIMQSDYVIPQLNWASIRYGNEEVDQVPDDKRGIYAFAINHHSDVLPPHGYILYIGIAGRKSTRTLRARYKDYLNEKKLMKRVKIARMVATWREILRFYFAPVEDNVSSEDLESLERQLNTALLPPFSQRDLDATVRQKLRAFS